MIIIFFICILVNPGSGSYNVVNHMIENSVKSYNEQDPEILRKKPPFNIQEERFNMPKNGSGYTMNILLKI